MCVPYSPKIFGVVSLNYEADFFHDLWANFRGLRTKNMAVRTRAVLYLPRDSIPISPRRHHDESRSGSRPRLSPAREDQNHAPCTTGQEDGPGRAHRPLAKRNQTAPSAELTIYALEFLREAADSACIFHLSVNFLIALCVFTIDCFFSPKVTSILWV